MRPTTPEHAAFPTASLRASRPRQHGHHPGVALATSPLCPSVSSPCSPVPPGAPPRRRYHGRAPVLGGWTGRRSDTPWPRCHATHAECAARPARPARHGYISVDSSPAPPGLVSRGRVARTATRHTTGRTWRSAYAVPPPRPLLPCQLPLFRWPPYGPRGVGGVAVRGGRGWW